MNQLDRDKNWHGRNLRWVLLLLGAIGIVLAAKMVAGQDAELLTEYGTGVKSAIETMQIEVRRLNVEVVKATREVENMREEVGRLDKLTRVLSNIHAGSPEYFVWWGERNQFTLNERYEYCKKLMEQP